MSLTCDGLTGAVQERMKSEYATKSGHMMLAINKWSIGYLGVALAATGEIWQFASFVGRHPAVLGELALFSVCSALGQYFIFMCVSEFGPLPCSIATTTRKFFTVLGSVVIFGNALAGRQWLGAVLVFVGKSSFRLLLPLPLFISCILLPPTLQACFWTASTERRPASLRTPPQRRPAPIDNDRSHCSPTKITKRRPKTPPRFTSF